LVANQFVLAVNPSLPVRNLQEFVEYARRTVPPLPYASGGNGSQHHLSMEILKLRAGIDLLHVPFKGGTPATMATVAGDTAAMFAGTSSKPQIKAGKLRALAATGAQRSPEFPELPTIGEFYPGYEVTIWLALFAPAGTPEVVLVRLRAAVEKALTAPEVAQRLNAAGGLEPFATTPDEFSALIRRDYDKYGKIVKAIGVKVD
jgi:tripartite-type tricarboxylate transporter receptor subunit TctC